MVAKRDMKSAGAAKKGIAAAKKGIAPVQGMKRQPEGGAGVDPKRRNEAEWAGVTRGALQGLALRSGVVRISSRAPTVVRIALKLFLQNIIRDSLTIARTCNRKTVTVSDVQEAMLNSGRVVAGCA